MTNQIMKSIMWFLLEDFPKPIEWPKKWRRAFLYTLPLSGPLWLVGMAALMLSVLTAMIVLYVYLGIASLWTGENLVDF